MEIPVTNPFDLIFQETRLISNYEKVEELALD